MKIIVFLFCVIVQNDGARILGVVPTPSYSHQIVFLPIFKELALRGHEVVLLTTNPLKDTTIQNLKEIDLSFSYNIVEEAFKDILDLKGFEFLNVLFKSMHNALDRQLKHEEVQNLIKNETEYFDLVMVESLFLCMYGFQYKFKSPFIGMMSLDGTEDVHNTIGNPTHPFLYPDKIYPTDINRPILQKVFDFGVINFMRIFNHFVALPLQETLIKNNFGENYPNIESLSKNMDMLFINANPVFSNIRPLTPTTINIGGGIHIQKEKPLPKELKEYLDNSKEGVIYFSLGSNMKSINIQDEIKKVILQTFSELPYKILWKFEDNDLIGKPENVKIMKWIPQQDVLRHPNIKLFITQGGLQSLDEGLFSNVPFIVMPCFADQETNAKIVQEKGLGLSVTMNSLTTEHFKAAILEVINNPIYYNKVRELARLVRDEPMNALERAVWWVEYVLRNKGAKHLRGPAVDVPFYKLYLLDIYGILFLGIVSIVYIIKLAIVRPLKFIFKKKIKTN